MLLVRDLMSREVATLGPEASAGEALTLCLERRIRHVPIVESGRLVGMISDRDLRDVSPPSGEVGMVAALGGIRVRDVMSYPVITARPQDPIEYAAREMYERKIDALPVVSEEPTASLSVEAPPRAEEDELLGIVTSSDMMRAVLMLAGTPQGASRVEVVAPDRPGVLPEVAAVLQGLGVDVVSAFTSPNRKTGNRSVVFMVAVENPSSVVESLQTAGYAASWTPRARRAP